MPTQKPDSRISLEPNKMFRYAAIGLEFFSPIIAGTVGGYYADQYFHTNYLGVIGIVAGTFLGVYRLVIEVRDFLKDL